MGLMYGALRRHMRLYSPEGDGGGGSGTDKGTGDPPKGGDGDDKGDDDDDNDDGGDDSDLNEADAAKLRETLKKERKARREAERERRRLAREKTDREKADQEAADEEARKKGEHQQLADREKTRADKAEADLLRERIVNRVHRHAAAANFEDVDDAVLHLRDDFGTIPVSDGVPDDDEIAKRVKKLTKDKPRLIKGERPPGLPNTNGSGSSGTTNGATQSYINARYGQKKS